MKRLFFLPFIFLFQITLAQKTKQDLSKDIGSSDRKLILESVKEALQPNLRLKPKLIVEQLRLKNGFAFFSGPVKDEKGRDIDFRKTAYRQEIEEGILDGDNAVVLLKKTAKGWKVLDFVIGPPDLAWGCWWKEFKAPKDIFDFAENDCNWVDTKK